MKIIRVFCRKTAATPDDDMVRIATTPGLFDDADEIHVPVIFTWDIPIAEQLEKQWKRVAPVRIGGGQRLTIQAVNLSQVYTSKKVM